MSSFIAGQAMHETTPAAFHYDCMVPTENRLLMFSGGLLGLQMKGWQSVSTHRYPALFMLHLAFAWTPAGLVLTGLAIVFPDQIAPAAALHALTMGAMGTMMAAVMTRSAMRRDGEALVANGAMACAFGLVSLSALLRVPPGLPVEAHFDAVVAAAICWMAAWTLVLVVYIPALVGPVPRPVFSAAIGDRGSRHSMHAQFATPVEIDGAANEFIATTESR
ncbi:NnrS family protein [Sinorhizobium garamanticum]|uniref:NnrS family protein n=1 Tax=Sinorhizobium garamanticum TaxID=680247 RepID=A0ABY8DI76_9HYPH|nr:NnrS family protein [Sinorhizobium garamanticum]WEX90584.1 NnrS family protein [Sinorhizobium garamanticum]